jgi:hypothetical protein
VENRLNSREKRASNPGRPRVESGPPVGRVRVSRASNSGRPCAGGGGADARSLAHPSGAFDACETVRTRANPWIRARGAIAPIYDPPSPSVCHGTSRSNAIIAP